MGHQRTVDADAAGGKVSDFDSALALALKVEEGLHHTAIMHSQNVSRLNLAARTLQTSIFVKNGPSYAGIGVGGEGFTTFTIATPTGEGPRQRVLLPAPGAAY